VNGNMLSCQLSIIVSAVINHLQSNEMYSFRVCADNLRGEKGQYSGEVLACTERSQAITQHEIKSNESYCMFTVPRSQSTLVG